MDKNCILVDSDEPVSQLHKCAFEFKNNSTNSTYLSLVNERIVGILVKILGGKPNDAIRFSSRVKDEQIDVVVLISLILLVGQSSRLIKQNTVGSKHEDQFFMLLLQFLSQERLSYV